MRRNRIIWLTITSALAWANVANGATSSLYEIISGSYSACCGIGGDIPSSLPNASQGFVRLTIDSQRHLTTMTFLRADARTVFSVLSCPFDDRIQFSFVGGLPFSDRIVFHADPGPPPYYKYWSYTASNSPNALRIEGQMGIAAGPCVDVPTHFYHSNVVAVLVPPPRIRIDEFSKEGALLFIQGTAGWTNVVEASTDLLSWAPISTNLMPATLCPICPYILVRDAAEANVTRRFYRCFEIP